MARSRSERVKKWEREKKWGGRWKGVTGTRRRGQGVQDCFSRDREGCTAAAGRAKLKEE
jgi:hypothetical protein